MHIICVDAGNLVICDLCNEDYTNSDKCGGVLYFSYAACPDCASRYDGKKRDIVRARKDETFRDFVYRMRT
jgi:hypothetical protein